MRPVTITQYEKLDSSLLKQLENRELTFKDLY